MAFPKSASMQLEVPVGELYNLIKPAGSLASCIDFSPGYSHKLMSTPFSFYRVVLKAFFPPDWGRWD